MRAVQDSLARRKGRLDAPVVSGHDHRVGAAKAIQEEDGLRFPCGCEFDPKARPYWVEARMVVREFFLAYARSASEARESVSEGLNGHLCMRTTDRKSFHVVRATRLSEEELDTEDGYCRFCGVRTQFRAAQGRVPNCFLVRSMGGWVDEAAFFLTPPPGSRRGK